MTLPRIGFIGSGRVATSLAGGLALRNYPVVAVTSRRSEPAQRLAAWLDGLAPSGEPCLAVDVEHVAETADIVFIATPDSAVESVASGISCRPGQAIVHVSGALTLEPLQAAMARGAHVGSFHPVQTFPLWAGEPSIEMLQDVTRDVAFGIEAEEPLFGQLASMAEALGGFPIRVEAQDRALYHAGAVLACGLMATLFEESIEVWGRAGLSREVATRALGRLADRTLANVRVAGVDAITGPMVRDDFETSRRHLTALRNSAPEVVSSYGTLAWRCVQYTHGQDQHAALEQWRPILGDAIEELERPISRPGVIRGREIPRGEL